MSTENDFSRGSVYRHIINLAVPMTIAQLVQVAYNIIDRIYIGHLPGASAMALTGLGVTFPVVTLVAAFTNLFGMGGAPLCSIERGKGNLMRAERIMGNTFFLLCLSSVFLLFFCAFFSKPMLYLFGAGDDSYPYAAEYLKIYLIGTPMIMIATGMNGFINSQGFAKEGMLTILIGAVINIILDPIFIFVFKLGISGAAFATVISQLISAIWVMRFLFGKKTILKLTLPDMKLDLEIIKKVLSLGTAGFVMQASNGAVQIACNSTLRDQGGEIYVGIMTVLNSVRDVTALPMQGLANASQPVLGFNLGAEKFDRIKKSIRFVTIVSTIYMSAVWLLIFLFPEGLMRVFNSDTELILKGAPAMHIFFFGLFMMAFHVSGQSIFVGLGESKQAVFFSLFRKVFIVVPLALFLPHLGSLGVNGVFMAEPISNFMSGVLCYIVMLITVNRIFTKGVNET